MNIFANLQNFIHIIWETINMRQHNCFCFLKFFFNIINFYIPSYWIKSTKTGLAKLFKIAFALEIIAKLALLLQNFYLCSNFSLQFPAAVPLETQQQNFLFVTFANCFSNLIIFWPLDDIQPLLAVL